MKRTFLSIVAAPREKAFHPQEARGLDPASGETVAALRSLDVRRAEFNLRERAVRLGAVKMFEAALLTRLMKIGHLNLPDLITLQATLTDASPKPPAPGAAPPPWTARADDFIIEQTAVSFEDLTRRTPFKTELKPTEVSLLIGSMNRIPHHISSRKTSIC